MHLEIELKLRIAPQDCDVLMQHPILKSLNTSQPYSEYLVSTYFDTDDQQLRRHGYALRIRESQGRFIQTVKSAGIQQNDLHHRHEWEYEINAHTPNISLLEDNELKNTLQNLLKDKTLQPIFKTEFERTTWQITFADSSHVEMVLDRGQATTATATSSINEIELELKSGSVEKLYEIADSLKASIQLTVENRSKAQQGYDLYNQSS